MAFFRKPATPGARRLTPTPTPAPRPAAEPLETIAVEARSLGEAELSPDGRLLFPGRSAVAPGTRAALLISGIQQSVFTVAGTMHGARGGRAGPRIEIEVDEGQRGLLTRILQHVQKGAQPPRPRAQRVRITLPAIVSTADGAIYMNTFSLSGGGCGLRWSGPAPQIGSVHQLRLGAGMSAPNVRAMVCWVEEQRSGARVGFRFIGGQEGRVEAMLDSADGAVVQP